MKGRPLFPVLLVALATLPLPAIAAAAEEPAHPWYCRQPDISRASIVFTCAGELWGVPRAGGLAHRLTDRPGVKSWPKFSPDGSTLAFVVDEPGDVVYAMPAAGGRPRRLTYYPSSGIGVLGWTPDGQKVLFRSQRSWFTGTLHTVPAKGGLEQELPMREGMLACFSPDGRQLAYNHADGGGSAWKGYRGGRQAALRVYDLARGTCRDLPRGNGNDLYPMWREGTLYFASDRAGAVNLFALDLKTEAIRQLTHFRDFDVRSPSLGPDAIVFERAGALYILDLATEKCQPLPIRLPAGVPQPGPPTRRVEREVLNFALAPSGASAVFEAYGELFAVTAAGVARNLTDSPGVREIDPAWSPDGRQLAYLSDRTGEHEVYVRPAEGGTETRLTEDGAVHRYGPIWSPDGSRLLYADAARRLWIVARADRKPVLVDAELRDPAAVGRWSPDGRWIAYAKSHPSGHSAIFLCSIDGRRTFPVSDGRFEDRQPVFDRGGEVLYFLSDRDFRRAEGAELSFRSLTGVFAAVLSANAPSPLGRKDERTAQRVDPDGVGSRIIQLPLPTGEIDNLEAGTRQAFYLLDGALHRYDLARQADEVILRGLDAYRLSSRGDRLLYRTTEQVFGIVDVAPGLEAGAGKLRLELTMSADPAAERRQMFSEAWRLYRDFFYDPGMHGTDWRAIRERYERLLPNLTCREDLTALLQEMIGELGTSHQHAWGPPGPEKENNDGLLGAELEEADGHYRFRKIYEGESWNVWRRAPLKKLGLDVREGDYLLAVDGRPLQAGDNPHALLQNTLGRHVTLHINSRPTETGARDIEVAPTRTESRLRYFDWVEGNRRRVEKASAGRVGYLHVPECNQWGMEEFVRGFYANADKDALIVDDRYNYGGDNSRFFVEKLARRTLTRGATRQGDDGVTGFADGPKVILVNEWCFSNGEFFPCLFRRAGLGPVIGTRTGGGFYGSMGGHRLLDGGGVAVSEMADWSGPERRWLGEGVGMEPDIPVANPPDLVHRGSDPQLERAVAYLLEQLKQSPPPRPKLPPLPQDRNTTLSR
jgi:tricorn protease